MDKMFKAWMKEFRTVEDAMDFTGATREEVVENFKKFDDQLIEAMKRDCVRCGERYLHEQFHEYGLCDKCYLEVDPEEYDCFECRNKCDYQYRTFDCYIERMAREEADNG